MYVHVHTYTNLTKSTISKLPQLISAAPLESPQTFDSTSRQSQSHLHSDPRLPLKARVIDTVQPRGETGDFPPLETFVADAILTGPVDIAIGAQLVWNVEKLGTLMPKPITQAGDDLGSKFSSSMGESSGGGEFSVATFFIIFKPAGLYREGGLVAWLSKSSIGPDHRLYCLVSSPGTVWRLSLRH